MNTAQQFDRHADTYDADLNAALSASGESKEYFAEKRVKWLKRQLRRLGRQPRCAIDYGCGIGDTSVLLLRSLDLESVIGLDVSARSLELAKQWHSGSGCRFLGFADHVPRADVDLVYSNGTFHHIPVAERASCVEYIRNSLRPGGLFSLWENNPWNLGTRYVMSQCAFDHDAVTLTPPEAARLLRAGGLEIIRTTYLFFFPRFLRPLRFWEPCLSRLPLGGQYQVLSRRPLG